jgi:hypothetical protein
MIVRVFALCTILAVAAAAAPTSTVTFHKDVEPILQRNCQTCHRPGEAAPMSLLSFKDVRPWAKNIREAVVIKKMPPWPADPHYGKFENDRSLSQKDIDTVVAWVDAGAPEGSVADAPKPVAWTDGWSIGKPDAIIKMPQPIKVQATGVIEYQYVIVHTGFTEDKWIQMAETRPGNRALVHHIIAFIREPGSKWLADYPVGVAFVPDRKKRDRGNRADGEGEGQPKPDDRAQQEAAAMPQGELLQGYAPGLPPGILRPGQAKLIKAGSDIVFQMHYTANGTAGEDQSLVGVVFAKEPVKERVLTMAASNPKFKIPAGDGNYKVDSEFTLGDQVKLVNLTPHMHLRGKDFEYRLVFPDGAKETILNVPHYDFNWQLYYYLAQQRDLPKGTRIECTAHYDNSTANKANPDATKEVSWGDQSWEEMMIGFFDIAIPVDKDPRSVFPRRQAPAQKAASLNQ